ncbi:MAG: tRNA (adenosine(37)-N6)-dimethylallyltransferase MiaA [Zetaproteobacteria bacterium]|nr:MAG: tRNA (adenosine(37)-N6)-dimethylallyltransferase MiaA [Zetaproteobacteria bacterium]
MHNGKDNKQIIHIIAGPTASGKSARAINLAETLDGVIINCDSMQIYDGLQTLTAQPSTKDLERVPHLLYSHFHPNDTCSAGNWREIVEPIIHDVLKQGKAPIIVGGSGLYIRALTDGLSPMPDVPQDIRDAAVKKQEELGNPAFHAELEKRDPVMAGRFHPFHTARLIRAWEVLEATGKSLSEWQKLARLAPPADWDFNIEVIIPERTVQHQRCNDRFLWMMDNGILDEVEEFSKRIESGEIRDNVALVKSLGYRPLLSYIKGEISKDDAITQSQARTRQYAKQQVTWFRNQLLNAKKNTED